MLDMCLPHLLAPKGQKVTRHEHKPKSSPVRSAGLTLAEWLTVIAITAALASIALPRLSTALANLRLRSAESNLIGSLLSARNEAIKRGVPVQMGPRLGRDWKSGWRVTAVDTGEPLDNREWLGRRIDVATAPEFIVYDGKGELITSDPVRIQLDERISDAVVASRCVIVDASGLPQATAGECR